MFEPKIKKMNGFIKFITFGFAAGITLAPFGIYLKEVYMKGIIIKNHEKIHWEQQLEMLIIFFYLWYIIEWFIRLFTNSGNVYKSLSFEREANNNEKNRKYLTTRKHYAWIKYLKI